MPKDKFKFRLRRDASLYYHIDAGAFATSATPVDLKHSVVDWMKLQMQWRRHSRYPGVFGTYSPDTVRFAKDAAKILRYLHNRMGGKEAVCELEIAKLNTTDQLYYPRAVCKINFSRYVNHSTHVDVMLIYGGLASLLSSFDSTDFAIALGEPGVDPDTDYVWMTGTQFKGAFNYETMRGGVIKINENTVGATFNTSLLGMIYINNDGEYGAGTGSTTICDSTGLVTALTSPWADKACFTAIRAGTYLTTFLDAIPLVMNWDIGNTQDVKVELHAMVRSADFSTQLDDQILYYNTGSFLPAGSTLSESTAFGIHHTFSYPIGAHLIIYFKTITSAPLGAGDADSVVITLPAIPVKAQITYSYTPDGSLTRSLSQWQLFRKLFHKLTGSTAIDPVSDYLTTDIGNEADVFNLNPIWTFYTCGDALRELYINAEGSAADPEIKASIQDFAKDGFVKNCAGIGIERDGSNNEILRFEHLSHFYQKAVLIKDLGDKIDDWKISPYSDYVGNNVKTGYKDQTYSDINGKYEFNTLYSYKTQVTSVQEDVEYVNPFRADPYGETYIRLNLANKTTTDSESDNDTCMMASNGVRITGLGVTPYPWQLDSLDQTVTAGLPTGGVRDYIFNLPLTNGRSVRRMLPWLKSNYYDLISPSLEFQTCAKNKDLEAEVRPGLVVTESDDIDLTATDDEILFKPYVFEFKAQVPIDLPELMAANPYGVFGFTLARDGSRYYMEGFVLECGITDATNDVYNFRLLCSPNTVIPDYL